MKEVRIEYDECSFLDGSRGDNIAIWWEDVVVVMVGWWGGRLHPQRAGCCRPYIHVPVGPTTPEDKKLRVRLN